MKFDDINELLHAIRMQALGARYAQDDGDEDDGHRKPDRELKVALAGWRFKLGRTQVYYPAERLPPMEDHDDGDEEPRLTLHRRMRLYQDMI